MREDPGVARFSPPTPRSRRLGRELRRLRGARGWNLDAAAAELHCSSSRVSRIESGEIKPRAGDVMELLHAYGIPFDGEPGESLLTLARDLGQFGWWQRLDALSSRYATYIAYEAEAVELHNFEPTLVPGLLQTEAYARVIVSVGRETDADAIEQHVHARLTRQDLLTRQPVPLRLNAILSEAALVTEVGSPEILREQLRHIVEVSLLPNVRTQVLRFAAGAPIATHGGFVVLSLEKDEPPLGYIETLAGGFFLETSRDIDRLNLMYDHFRTLAMSPSESIEFIKQRAGD
jgi:transcriptional regulator with XRE-family HTH domain